MKQLERGGEGKKGMVWGTEEGDPGEFKVERRRLMWGINKRGERCDGAGERRGEIDSLVATRDNLPLATQGEAGSFSRRTSRALGNR